MKYIITGGAGFIGSHLVDALIEKGDEVIVIDDLSTGKKENVNPKAKFYELDIADYEKIRPVFNGVDGVFHLAALARVPVSVADPIKTNEINVSGTLNVFWASKEAGAKRIVYVSSSAVYGDQDKLPLVETITPKPINPYGLQKLLGEEYARLFKELYDFPIVSLRYFNVFGPRIDPNNEYSLVIGKFIKQRLENKPLTIYGDGNQSRGFNYVSDVVEATILAMESEKIKGGEIINIGSEIAITINRIADLIGGERVYLAPRVGDMLHAQADIGLAKKILNWQPKIDFETGLQKTKEYFGLKQ